MFTPAITTDMFANLAMACTKYSAGRMTYMPSFTQEVVRNNASAVPGYAREAICAVVTERHEAGALGMDFDDEGWVRFEEFLREGAPAFDGSAPCFRDEEDFWLFAGGALRHDVVFGEFISPDGYAQLVSDNISALSWKWHDNLFDDIKDILGSWAPLADVLAQWQETAGPRPY